MLYCRRYYFAILQAESRQPLSNQRAVPLSNTSVVAAVAASSAPTSVEGAPSSLDGAASASAATADGSGGDRGLVAILPPFKRAAPSAFTDVRLGPLIGRGAYGRVRACMHAPPGETPRSLHRCCCLHVIPPHPPLHDALTLSVPSTPTPVTTQVYRGSWNGTTVAVKVIETADSMETADTMQGKNGIFEAVLSSNLSHPNIVHTYQYAFRQVLVRFKSSAGWAEQGLMAWVGRFPWAALAAVGRLEVQGWQ